MGFRGERGASWGGTGGYRGLLGGVVLDNE